MLTNQLIMFASSDCTRVGGSWQEKFEEMIYQNMDMTWSYPCSWKVPPNATPQGNKALLRGY